MARDIEEFLRRAAERRKQNQGGQGAPPPAPRKPVAPPVRPASAPPKQRLAKEAIERTADVDPYAQSHSEQNPHALQRRQPKQAPAPPKPPQAPKKKRRESIEEHVRNAIVVSDVTERSRHLGEEVGLADERLEARLERFDHSMGSLEGSETVTDDETSKVEGPDKSKLAGEILDLFRSPKSIRQSILVSEILKRPDFDDDE